jgi:2-keto-3-deoxy-L-rhamnonate aldolase RhmA
MRTNLVKAKLAKGSVAFGTMAFEFATTGIGRIIAGAGAEFVIYDLEHTGWSLETVRMLMATSPVDLVSIVRVPATEYHFMARSLDVGAMGLMVPMVESADQARRIVESAKYPPAGRRGAAFGVAHDDYRGADLVGTMVSGNAEGLLIAQIETANGVENVEAIAAIDGIDVLWVGQFDLTNSLGVAGEMEHPRYHAAVDRVLAACKRHSRAAGFMAGTVEQGRVALKQGFRMLAYSGDIWLYQQALREGLSALRQNR